MKISKLRVSIQGATKAWQAQAPNIRLLVKEAAQAAFPYDNAELTIQLSNDAEVCLLNAQFRGKDKPTNVLSFPSGEWQKPSLSGKMQSESLSQGERVFLGDIILARETIEREAGEQGKSVAAHLQHLVVHGVLHLMGYDHEIETEAEEMEAIEITILKSLGVDNPYALD